MSAIQKGRYNLSERERKKRKQQRRIERTWRTYYAEIPKEETPVLDFLAANIDLIADALLVLCLLGLLALLIFSVSHHGG